VTVHSLIARAALAAALAAPFAACSSPEVVEKEQVELKAGAPGGTQNRENPGPSAAQGIAPPGQGSALSDTAGLTSAPGSQGPGGPTQQLSPAAPRPQNANAQTRSQVPDSTAGARRPARP
jgi:hypothetical protein